MKLFDLWNMCYNFQKVKIKVDDSVIFNGEMGNVPMKLNNWSVVWINAIEDILIIDIDCEDK